MARPHSHGANDLRAGSNRPSSEAVRLSSSLIGESYLPGESKWCGARSFQMDACSPSINGRRSRIGYQRFLEEIGRISARKRQTLRSTPKRRGMQAARAAQVARFPGHGEKVGFRQIRGGQPILFRRPKSKPAFRLWLGPAQFCRPLRLDRGLPATYGLVEFP
jgi:hypothetical protein